MSEHSGGAPKTAIISLDSWSEESFEVHPVFNFDPTCIDTMSDILKEASAAGVPAVAVLEKALEKTIRLRIAHAVRRALMLVREAHKSRLVSDQIYWLMGGALYDGITIGDMAKRHGISKQAFQQGAEKFRKLLYEIRSQSARPEKSRAKMRLRNSRRTKYERTNTTSKV